MAAVGTPTVVLGEAEMSDAPGVVPMTAVCTLLKVGTRVSVAPNSGVWVAAESEAVGAATTLTVVLTNLVASSAEVAVMVTEPAVAGAVQTPAEVMVPAVALHVTVLVRPPVAVALKVVRVPTVRVGDAGLTGLTATVCGVTAVDASTESPAALVARIQ